LQTRRSRKDSYTTNEQKRHQRAATGRYNTELTLAQAHFGGAVHRFSAATDHKLSDAKQPARNYVTFPNTPQTSTRSSRPSANSRRISEKQPNEQAVSQRLARSGLKIEEFPQSSPNLTAASQNLFELLIQGHGIIAYPDSAMRLAISRAVAIETPRGFAMTSVGTTCSPCCRKTARSH
jgi:hypothetical protein